MLRESDQGTIHVKNRRQPSGFLLTSDFLELEPPPFTRG